MNSKNFFLVLFMFVHFNCFSQSNNFDIVLEIGPDELIGAFITDVNMGPDGSVAVALNDLARVNLYDLQGELIKEYGRRGRGPGDFSNLMSVHVSESAIYALDAGPGGRVNIFERDEPERFRTFNLPRSGESYPLRMWYLYDGNFLVEYRPGYTIANLEESITSTYAVISRDDNLNSEKVFQHQSNEMFLSSSNGSFSVSDMPFGRENHIVPLQDGFIHNWSDDKELTRIDAESGIVVDTIDPNFSAERVSLSDQDYSRYFLDELGIPEGEDVNEALHQLSTDASIGIKLRGVQAKLESRDELHTTFSLYRWVAGDSNSLCFGLPDADRVVTRVECTDLDGEPIRNGKIDASIEILGLQGRFLYGIRKLDQGMRSVVVLELTP